MRFLSTIFLLSILSISASFAEVNEIWVSSDYSSGGTNDGHTWGVDAFSSIASAMPNCTTYTDQLIIYVESDLDEINNGMICMVENCKIYLNNYTVVFNKDQLYNYSETSYFVCNANGRLVILDNLARGTVPQFGRATTYFYPIGTVNLYRPVKIEPNSPSAYFGVKVISWSLVPTLCYWDVEKYLFLAPGESPQPQLNGFSADLTFIYDKENVPEGVDVTSDAFIYHFPGPEWTDLGSGSTSSWETDNNYWATTINNVEEFSPFTVGSSSLVIPTMTEWTLIILGSLLALGGGILVWRKLS